MPGFFLCIPILASFLKKGKMKENTLSTITPDAYVLVAKTYAQVFAGEPWREVSKCNKCGNFSDQSPEAGTECSCGGIFNVEAYPRVETTQYVATELARADAIGLMLSQLTWLKQVQRVNGFGWGYRMSPAELAARKYRSEQMQALVTELLVSAGFFYYVSEVGVLPEEQGNGYGTKLTSSIIDQAETGGYREFVVRTNEDSGMRYILEKLGMKPVIGLNTGIKDSENEARVLFVGNK